MDIALVSLGILLLVVGIAGCFLPVLPGPPLSYAGLLLLHLTDQYEFSLPFLLAWGVIAVLVTLLDYVVPIWGTQRFGGSAYGIRGSVVGLILGIFLLPPVGLIVGPFVGAVIGELFSGKNGQDALRAGLGSFAGFLAGTLIKLVASLIMAWYFLAEIL